MITKFGIVLAAGSLLGSMQAHADGYQRWIEVVNRGNAAIEAVYITTIDERDGHRWGNVLGGYLIHPGYSRVVEPNYHGGYCRFDIMVTYENGSEVPVWNINLCEAVEVDVSDIGYTQVGY